MTEDQIERLSAFDDEAAPADPSDSLPSTKDLADGIFVCDLLGAEMTETPKDRDLMLRLKLNARDINGVELLCSHAYPFSSVYGARVVSRLLADLIVLGIDAERWTPANKRPFSTELTKLLTSRRLVGLRFQAKKESWDGGQAFKIGGLLKSKAPSAPMGTTAAASLEQTARHGGMVIGQDRPPVRQGSPRPAPAPATQMARREPVPAPVTEDNEDSIPF